MRSNVRRRSVEADSNLYADVERMLERYDEAQILDALAYYARIEGESAYRKLAVKLDDWAEDARDILERRQL